MDEEGLIQFLADHEIPYRRYDHPAVFTVAEVDALEVQAPGMGSKNLLLRDENRRRYVLLMVAAHKRVDLKRFGQSIGIPKKLHFAAEEDLQALLGVGRGSVTVLGVINDTGRRVEVLIDRELWRADFLHCHPLVNTATLVMAPPDLARFLDLCGHPAQFVDVPGVD